MSVILFPCGYRIRGLVRDLALPLPVLVTSEWEASMYEDLDIDGLISCDKAISEPPKKEMKEEFIPTAPEGFH